MNAAENIVESYFRHVRGIYTRSNVKGEGQSELDVIGVDPTTDPPEFYHIESAVSLSIAYSRITNRPYSAAAAKQRVMAPKLRMTAGAFIEKKFYSRQVQQTYKSLRIRQRHLHRIVVAWGFEEDAAKALRAKGIECLTMKELLQELADHLAQETKDIDSDVLRTIQLYVRAEIHQPTLLPVSTLRSKKRKGLLPK